MTRYGRVPPGLAVRPNPSVSGKVPAGVRLTVSLAMPTPAEPTRADTGPTTGVQPEARFSQAVRVAVVDEPDGTVTVTSWVPGGATPSGRLPPAAVGVPTTTAPL